MIVIKVNTLNQDQCFHFYSRNTFSQNKRWTSVWLLLSKKFSWNTFNWTQEFKILNQN